MKATINGKRYDTTKATLIAEVAASGSFQTDFNWFEEGLYKTPRSGAYFIAGRGNARTHYAMHVGGGTYGSGSKITPVTPDEAMRWLEEHGLHGAIEREFADRIKDA